MAKETKTTVLPGITSSVDVDVFDYANTGVVLSANNSISSEPKLIFSKTTTADSGYYYPVEPKIEVTSEDPTRYFINTRDKKFTDKKHLNSITFDIYFLFTNSDVRASDGDKFNIISNPKKIPIKIAEQVSNVVLEGDPITEEGGIKTIKAYGDPGSTMNLVLKDNYGKYCAACEDSYYNWDNNTFSSVAKVKSITIPTEEDFPGFLPQDYTPGVYTEDITFKRNDGTITSYSVIAIPTGDSYMKSIKELDLSSTVGEAVESEEVITPSV